MSFHGIVRYQDGSQNNLFDDNTKAVVETVEVLPHEPPKPPLWLRLEMPNPEKSLWMSPWREAVTIKVTLQEGNQQDSRIDNLENYITAPDKWLSMQRVDKSGVPISAPIALKKDNENNLVGEIPLKINWAQGEGWAYPGQINLQFIAQMESVRDERSVNGVWLPPGLEDKRVNGDPMTVGAIEIRVPVWIYLLFIGLVVLALVIGFILVRLFVYPSYWLRSNDARRKVELKIYDSVEDPDGSNAKKFLMTRQLNAKLDNQIKITTKDDKIKTALQFRVKRELTTVGDNKLPLAK